MLVSSTSLTKIKTIKSLLNDLLFNKFLIHLKLLIREKCEDGGGRVMRERRLIIIEISKRISRFPNKRSRY